MCKCRNAYTKPSVNSENLVPVSIGRFSRTSSVKNRIEFCAICHDCRLFMVRMPGAKQTHSKETDNLFYLSSKNKVMGHHTNRNLQHFVVSG